MLTLDDVAAEFAARPGMRLDSPGWTRERCEDVPKEFVTACRDAGIQAEVISGLEMEGNLVLNGHFAVQVGIKCPVVYDWTARQFDPAADVPVVTTLTQWRKTWMTAESLQQHGYLLVKVAATADLSLLSAVPGVLDVEEHGKECCCSNCPWKGNHGRE